MGRRDRGLILLALPAVVAMILGITTTGSDEADGMDRQHDEQARARAEGAGPEDWRTFSKPDAATLRARLDARQYAVTQENATEPSFQNDFWNHHAEGIYVDIVSGEPLFSSRDKFDSGCGWPSFTQPLVPELVLERTDRSHGMQRVEVRSTRADSHLGHLFEDGPAPNGLRYCINSAALRFVPVDSLAAQGYADFLPLFQRDPVAATGAAGEAGTATTETALLAGGCFWGMEDILRDIPGVIATDVGYTGGTVPNPTYRDVCGGRSGHAEAVRVVFDPRILSFEELLGYFFRMHDPTTPNRQGNDGGTQYRSAIFHSTEAQRAAAERVKAEVDRSGKWKQPIVTEIVPAGEFYVAEDGHQDYLERNPHGYSCHYLRD